MPPRVFGVSHTEGVSAFFGLDINEFFPFLVKEGTANSTASEIEERMADMRSLHETRLFTVLAEGSAEFISSYKAAVDSADWFIACASEATLAQLGIPILDAGWKHGDPQLDLTRMLLGGS